MAADVLPFDFNRIQRLIPWFACGPVVLLKIPALTVTYDEVASAIISNIGPDTIYKGQRVGIVNAGLTNYMLHAQPV